MTAALACFKAYDIRGRVPDELNPELAYRIGRAYGRFIQPGSVVVGRDVRLTGPAICQALIKGLTDERVNVLDIGLCGTEEVYFATWNLRAGGGIMVTASHNPADYNGMKLVRHEARPISGDTGLDEIRRLVQEPMDEVSSQMDVRGRRQAVDNRDAYIRHLLQYVDQSSLKPLKLVVNAGNGCAGPVIDRLEPHLPFRMVKLNHEPDGAFPHGVPNPLLEENRAATREVVRSAGADFGIAWDGDFDRCFLFDEKGEFIEGYYIVGLLAEAMLQRDHGGRIVHDPRLVWNTRDVVQANGGTPIQCKTGHAFIKERMRQEDAIYGGEMSAHHYFRDFAYCDSGMIPWLLVAGLVSASDRPLSELVAERIAKFPCSGEINRKLSDPAAALTRVRDQFAPVAVSTDTTDGLSLEFDCWRFNLRLSNTEPVLRLNVETRQDMALLAERTRTILALIDQR